MEGQAFWFLGESLNIFLGIGGLIVVWVLFFIVTYNSIVKTKNIVKESFSSIDTVLQNRYDLIPNLVQVVKQYMAHESGVITQVTELRASLMSNSNKTWAERFEQENALQAGLKSIFAVAENYPDLKASTNFLELQNQWSEIEDRLQWARRAYNSAVKELNNKKEMFPSNIIAGMMTLEDYKMFEAEVLAKTEKMDAKKMFTS